MNTASLDHVRSTLYTSCDPILPVNTKDVTDRTLSEQIDQDERVYHERGEIMGNFTTDDASSDSNKSPTADSGLDISLRDMEVNGDLTDDWIYMRCDEQLSKLDMKAEKSIRVQSTDNIPSQGECKQLAETSSGESNTLTPSGQTSGKLSPNTQTKKVKVCRVCGDKAFGFNFNAVTCESCKAFFRRSASKVFKRRCQGDCEVTIESRSYCKHCRLKKCFTVGMKKELISCASVNRKLKSEVEVTSSTVKTEKPIVPCSTFTAEEEIFIQELKAAYHEAFGLPGSCGTQLPAIGRHSPSSVEFINLANNAVMKIIKMAKSLQCFKILQQNDQIALLKGGVIEMMVLRSSSAFDPQILAWQIPQDTTTLTTTLSADSYASELLSKEMYAEFLKFMARITNLIKRDDTIIALMMMLSLFSPDRETVTNKASVSKSQELYANSLTKYVHITYPSETLMVARVLQVLTDIRDMSQIHATSIQKGANLQQIDPLLVEVFNLP